MKTRIIESKSHNPWFNLAIEEYLLNDLEDDEVCLYLWQNAHTIVIGKHQNPWKEVNTELLENDGGKLARRLTGGGAVYHDLGNMNFTFAMDAKHNDLNKQLKVILEAVKKVGINAEFSGRNDILAEGRKFSGNAFYQGKGRYIHHGTIMFDVNMKDLGKYLNVSEKKLKSKAVDSVKSRVINLCELNKDITVPVLYKNIADCFEEIYANACNRYIYDEENCPDSIKEYSKRYGSWEWLYGKSPDFDYSVDERFEWGEIAFHFNLKDAKITDCTIFSDAMDTRFIDELKSCFIGINFVISDIVGSLKLFASKKEEYKSMLDDLINFFETLSL